MAQAAPVASLDSPAPSTTSAAPAAKRWHERFVLFYTPVWIAAVAACMFGPWLGRWEDPGHLALGVGLALPLWLGPLLWPAPADRGRPLLERHGIRWSLWIAVHTFLQMYFGSILFFDRLGMEYHFRTAWELNRSPVFLYFLTICYFSTYYAVFQRVLGECDRRFPAAPRGSRLLVRAGLCYATAFAETFFMGSEVMAPFFRYRDRGFMLAWGSVCYGTVFFVSLPLILGLDEREQPSAPLGEVLLRLLGANMLILVLYEIYGGYITWWGPRV
jgi:cycloeucalenol cycloisomerase